MKIHPREERCRKASCDLIRAIGDIGKKHNLTELELNILILNEMSSYLSLSFKYALRMERHGNTDTPAGLAD